MKINKITGKDCKATRPLWQEVFYEDSVKFTDYYFRHKADKNIGYVIGQEPYDAMMFRTPYKLQIGEKQRNISYIVGVATRKECRHRGYMRELLMHSFEEMYQEKEPFAFLMPANPAIYEPFDFRYVYERDVWKLKEGIEIEEWLEVKTELKMEYIESDEHELRAAEFDDNSNYRIDNIVNGLYSVSGLQEQFPDIPILDMLARFTNEYLEKHYNIYVHRDEEYYEMQLKESKAQNGDIYVLFEQGEIKAFFLYAKEGDEVFIQEVVGEEEDIPDFLQKEEMKKPIIMARIIHLEEMLKLVCSSEYTEVILKIEDELILQNSGVYNWKITPNGSNVTKLQSDRDGEKGELRAAQIGQQEEEVETIFMHIRELAPYILQNVFINEIV